MLGWENNACDLCGAPYCLCDCADQLKIMNEELKTIRDNLARRVGVTYETVTNRGWISPEFLVALRSDDTRRSLLRALVKEIPAQVIIDAYISGAICANELLTIDVLRAEANVSFLKRWWRDLWEDN